MLVFPWYQKEYLSKSSFNKKDVRCAEEGKVDGVVRAVNTSVLDETKL